MKKTTKKYYKRKNLSRRRKYSKKIGGKLSIRNPTNVQPIPLPSVPPPINPVITNDNENEISELDTAFILEDDEVLDLNNTNGGRKRKDKKIKTTRKSKRKSSKTYKGGFKTDVVDDLEDRDDDWIITKQ